MTEDREQNTSEDRDANIDEVEGHSLPGQTRRCDTSVSTAGQNAGETDEDEPDVEGHALIGQNISANTASRPMRHIGANTGEPTDANIA